MGSKFLVCIFHPPNKCYLQLRLSLELSTPNYDKEKIQERLAKLSGGVVVLKVNFSAKA